MLSETQINMKKWEVANGYDPAVVAAHLMCRPHIIFRPAITVDGNKWCALYGENLQEGIAGFGDTPKGACEAFDKAWNTCLTPKAAFSQKAQEA